MSEHLLFLVIAAGEVAFWVFLAAGLLARYLLRMPRLGLALLACTALVDVVLLVAAAGDLLRGAEATFAHGLAAAYLGFSVAFAHRLIRWADGWAAYRLAGGPRPEKPQGAAKVRHAWTEWRQVVVAWAVSCAIMLVLVALVGDADRTGQLWGWMQRLSAVAGIWFFAGPVWTTVEVVGGARGARHNRAH